MAAPNHIELSNNTHYIFYGYNILGIIRINTKIILVFSLVVFLAGLYYYATIEGMTTTMSKETGCPDLLIRKGNTLLLYNTKYGGDPLPFYNLDEYINYLEIQRRAGTVCPVLFLQYESTAQGTDVYRMRPSPFDLQGGTPAQY